MFLNGQPQIDVTMLPDELRGKVTTVCSGAVVNTARVTPQSATRVRKLLGTAYSGTQSDEQLGKVGSGAVGNEELGKVDSGAVVKVPACW